MRIIVSVLFLSIIVPLRVGAQWSQVAGFPVRVTTIYFQDKQGAPGVGFAGLADGEIHRTTDGGHTWSSTASVLHEEVKDITFKDRSTGWACALSTTSPVSLARTTDGGLTWHPLSVPGLLTALHYNPTYHRLFVSSWNNASVMSTDDGDTWTSFAPNSMNGTAWLSDDVGFIAVLNHVSYHTNDGGAHWQPAAHDDPECWQPLGIPSQSLLLATCEGLNVVIRSTDGGQNWLQASTLPVGVQATGMLIGNEQRVYAQTTEDGFLMSTDLGTRWQNICGPSNAKDTRCYFADPALYAADEAGGFWVNNSGIEGPIVAANIQPADPIVIVTRGCQNDSTYFTIRSPSACGIELDSIWFSNQDIRVPSNFHYPKRLLYLDSVPLLAFPKIDQPETTLVSVRYSIGDTAFDASFRLIIRKGHTLSTGIDSSTLPMQVLFSCEDARTMLQLRSAPCDSMVILSASMEDSAHFKDSLMTPITVRDGGVLRVPITAAGDTSGEYKSHFTLHYLEGGEIHDTTLTLTLEVLENAAPSLFPATLEVHGSCRRIDTMVTLSNSTCDSLLLDSVTSSDTSTIRIDFSKFPLRIIAGGRIAFAVTIFPPGTGTFHTTLRFSYRPKSGGASNQLLVDYTVNISSETSLKIPALTGTLTVDCPMLDTTIPVVNSLCDSLILTGALLSDSSEYSIGPLRLPIVLHPGDSLRFPLSLDPRTFGLHLAKLRLRFDHDGATLNDSVSLSLFSFGASRRLPTLTPTPAHFNASACTDTNLPLLLSDLGCTILTIDSIELLSVAHHGSPTGFSLGSITLPLQLHSAEQDTLPLHIYSSASSALDSIHIVFGSGSHLRDTVIAISAQVLPAIQFSIGTTTLRATICGDGLAECSLHNYSGCDVELDSLFLSQLGSQFAIIPIPALPIKIRSHDSLQFLIQFDPHQSGDSLAALHYTLGTSILRSIPLKGTFSDQLDEAHFGVRFASTSATVEHSTIPGSTTLVLVALSDIPATTDLTTLHTAIRVNADALTMKNISGFGGWVASNKVQSSAGVAFDLTRTATTEVLGGTTLAAIDLTSAAVSTQDTVPITLAQVDLQPEDSLYSRCVLAAFPDTTVYTEIFTEDCGDPTLRRALGMLPIIIEANIEPNPTSGHPTLYVNCRASLTALLSISDILGRSVKPARSIALSRGLSQIPLDLADLPTGTYALTIETPTGSRTLRIVLGK